LLINFENYYNSREEDDDIDPLLKLPILHYQFEAIHPFLDGNGRTGRILVVLYLVLIKCLDYPMLFLSESINRNKSDYYKMLNDLDETENGDIVKKWKDWILWMLKTIEIQSIKTTNTVYTIKTL
jgi:Fic family protein